ncbi:hypothetical protein [Helicobacter kayseriensis]|uniref:hypothetical protein n=1 Tax=Helicobacter kayseriensis TaxID=2905877 RepID=UPI001E4D2A1E|nr:hypothetical protein [Helicobacter kayseriensis]MCE3047818.1 hypothetical protein [Helicobacter kayseriensis]MCE3049184.1 hypothetical protein [Helicobacter kayseriensis]
MIASFASSTDFQNFNLSFYQESISQLDHRISFFSSPYFNFHKLIQWIKEQENNQKIQTNYLILSQCPTKSNAGLSEALIQKLGHEIKDEINPTPQSHSQCKHKL